MSTRSAGTAPRRHRDRALVHPLSAGQPVYHPGDIGRPLLEAETGARVARGPPVAGQAERQPYQAGPAAGHELLELLTVPGVHRVSRTAESGRDLSHITYDARTPAQRCTVHPIDAAVGHARRDLAGF